MRSNLYTFLVRFTLGWYLQYLQKVLGRERKISLGGFS
jgi:hypothetical protein